MPIATTRPPIPQPTTGLTTATLGSTVRIDGQIFSAEDLFVDGQVEGSIELPGHKLTVGPNAKVKASIKAQHVVIIGAAEGSIEAPGQVELGPKCSVLGDIKTASIVIAEGAYFKGGIDIIRHAPNPEKQGQ